MSDKKVAETPKKAEKPMVEMQRGKGAKQMFTFDHALKLMRLQGTNTGKRQSWSVTDKKWEFKDNEIIKR